MREPDGGPQPGAGRAITITVDGATLPARPGQTIAGALMTSGRKSWGQSLQGHPRGLFCGMGICFECVVTVDGMPNVRACTTQVREGMKVETAGAAEVPR